METVRKPLEARVGSYVETWVVNKLREQGLTTRGFRLLDCSEALRLRIFFSSMMYTVTLSLRHDPARMADGLDEIRCEADKKYAGDSTLFEVGCYLCFRLEQWLLAKEREYRNTAQDSVREQFCQLFADALEMPNVPKLVNQRIDQYARLADEADSAKRSRHVLEQLIMRSADNTHPREYHAGSEPLLIGGLAESLDLSITLQAFEETMVPVVFDTLEKCMAQGEY